MRLRDASLSKLTNVQRAAYDRIKMGTYHPSSLRERRTANSLVRRGIVKWDDNLKRYAPCDLVLA